MSDAEWVAPLAPPGTSTFAVPVATLLDAAVDIEVALTRLRGRGEVDALAEMALVRAHAVVLQASRQGVTS